MTEEEAKTKWCPFVRFSEDQTDTNASNRCHGNASDWTFSRCIGSACMAWRWQKVDALINRETRKIEVIDGVTIYSEATHLPTKLISDTDGFCGLAGQP